MSSQLLSPALTSLVQKYNLDISVVEVKNLGIGNRIWSEYYQSHLLWLDNLIRKHETCILWDYIEVLTDWKHGWVTFTEKWVVFIRNQNNKEWYMDLSDKKYISIKESEESKRAELEVWDILLTTIWTIWESSVVPEWFPRSNINQNLVRIKLRVLSPYYISTFFNSKYWRLLLYRFVWWNVQPILNYPNIRNLEIPLPSTTFQSRIAELVQEAHIQRELSKSFYAEAEQILLKELGLIDWTHTEVSITEKMSEEVRLFGRCDAEFFQPKYDELFERLSKFQTQKLGAIVDYQKWVESWADAYSESGIPFIRVADVSIEGVDTIEKNISTELFAEYGERYSPKKDDILFTKDGTIGISFVVNENMIAVLSGAFLRLQKKIDIESEYLALVLNSVVSKMQIERFSGGAIIAHLKPSDAMEILIPIVSPDIQSLISSLIITSHRAREASKKLLEKAKRAVEIFIEEDETTAGEFLRGL